MDAKRYEKVNLLFIYFLSFNTNVSNRIISAIKFYIEIITTLLRSIIFIKNNLRKAPCFKSREDLLTHSISKVKFDGLFMEFGVFKGKSINYIASQIGDKKVYGFDSFEGMPEYFMGQPVGTFKLNNLPEVRSNVELVKGYFQDTLMPFLEEHTEKAAFIHLDAVLYSSTKYVLFTLAENNRLQSGTVIEFDEIFNYESWWNNGEYRALIEFTGKFGVTFEYIGYLEFQFRNARPVSIKILKI